MTKLKLLIVDDDEHLRAHLKWALAKDYEVFLAGDRSDALAVLRSERPVVVLLDLGLPPRPEEVDEGFLVLADLLEEDSLLKVIIMTGRAEKAHALRAIGQGAYDFLGKPMQVEELKVILHRAFHVAQLEREHRVLQQRLRGGSVEGMLGTSLAIQGVFAAIRKLATTEVPVLILGESGTGKELVARAIHRQGVRGSGPFVAINCGAIPETLLESELFGHEKGAFTGAHIQRKGRIEVSQGGTLFLDEIGELSLPLQVKLLRFLQEQQIERVGGREAIHVDARVMAATNMDLKQAMSEGHFREDLFYRLGVVVLTVPPLRKREGDILLLATAMLHRYAAESQKKVTGFNAQALRAVEAYHWPGNVRELENRIRRGVIMADGPRLTPEDLELASSSTRSGGLKLREAREGLERDLIQRAMSRHQGNITQAAAELGISRPTLYDRMGKLGMWQESAQ